MWTFNTDYNKWFSNTDKISRSNFDYLKQELASTRFYSKCLSGAAYLPVNNLDNIYDILGEYQSRNWFINIAGSTYTNTLLPVNYQSPINNISSYDYYTKYVSEYGLTLKNLFTPDRLIKDANKNFIYVDVATTEQIINLGSTFNLLFIDGVKILNGHRILVKNQVSSISLSFDLDPKSYFKGPYTVIQDYGTSILYSYYNSENGVYLFNNGRLSKTNDLTDYSDCIRYSVSVKLGTINTQKQFHLSRLLNGYYPTTSLNEPIEFKEKHNWLLRNKVDYNNLFEINYYDVLKHDVETYSINSITYSIPERTIGIGEFGVILNTQYGVSNIIPNKYKVNLRSINSIDKYYWICGDDGLLLKVGKHDFNIEKIDTNVTTNLKSVSFFNGLRGVIVGELNTILITKNGGITWDKIIVDDFDSYHYNKAIFYSFNKIYVVGNSGVFLELEEDNNEWNIYKRRVSRFIDDYEEYLLIDNINDIYSTKLSNWGVTFSYFPGETTSTNKELLFLVTNDSKIIVYDINNCIPHFDFVYLDFDRKYGDINSIIRLEGSNYFYFNFVDDKTQGISGFELDLFNSIGTNNQYSNSISVNTQADFISDLHTNKIFNYNSLELLICGNDSLLKSAFYNIQDPSIITDFNILDTTFEGRLKSKMLFLDYDIANKLNFFTDAGEYRLPNSATFDLISTTAITFTSSILNTPILSSGTIVAPIIVSITESNIIPREIIVTLNLSNNSLNNLNINLKAPDGKIINLKVTDNVIGKTFSNTKFTTNTNISRFSFSQNSINSDYTNKTYQMDKIIGVGAIGNISNTNIISDLDDILNGSWTLYITSINNTITSSNGSGSSGSGIGIGNLITSLPGLFKSWDISFDYQSINQVSATSPVSDLWFEPLVHGATAPSFMTQSETNWLTYWKDTSKTFKYYAGDILNDKPLDKSTAVLMSTTFSYHIYDTNLKNYFGLTLSSNDITNSIDDIVSLAPSILDNELSKFNGQPPNNPISTPSSAYTIYVYDYIMILRVNSLYPVKVGDTIRLESDVVDGNFVVNRLGTVTMPLFNPQNDLAKPAIQSFKLIYMFTNFNDNIINNLVQTTGDIKIVNLNKYKTIPELQDRFNLHDISNAYELIYSTSSNTININAKFNNLTSYYNLATKVFMDDNIVGVISKTMSYTDGFLKFGYTPTYNILDYLEKNNDNTVSNPKFYADKEYLAMPNYIGIPSNGNNDLLPNNIKILTGTFSSTTTQENKIYFGTDLILEWESIFINTFIDVKIYTNTTNYNTERLLVMKKYKNTNTTPNSYVIEFHKALNYKVPLDSGNYVTSIDITSRRKLSQISSDLQELNNIQRGRFENVGLQDQITSTKLGTNERIYLGSDFYNYERELNFKISTDSYAKILLSDVDTVKELSALIYIDNKNELAMNVTRLEKEYNIPIQGISPYTPVNSTDTKLYIQCTKDHDLKTGDAVVLDFGASQSIKIDQYYGFHNITVASTTAFYIDKPFNSNISSLIGVTGSVKYTKRDPFFNYQPVDITDIGIDKRGKSAIELSIDNLKLSEDVYSLVNVDFEKFRFRLIDGLTIDTLTLKYPWILEAEITDAIIGTDGSNLVWYKGNWECGRWFGGIWHSGTWKSGDWYGGTWNAKKITDNLISVDVANNTSNKELSTWFTGRWYDGTWNDGVWVDGRWYGGTWNAGDWYKGIWNDGTWNSGEFSGGVWVQGTWNSGVLNCNNEGSYWLDGKWNSGDFENGIWYKGIFQEKNGIARFGTKSFNSRNAIWHSGQWLSGSFYSRMILDNSNNPEVSLSHKYSIWHTGSWYSGDLYGGIVYDVDFKSGTWHGGILEDIQIISVNTILGFIKLNGIFKFNIGDEITILGNDPFYKNFFKSIKYKVIKKTLVDSFNNSTNVYIDFVNLTNTLPNAIISTYEGYVDVTDVETNMRIASRFKNVNWLSGIWTNGIFESGTWQGGIWYNGQFLERSKWS